MSTSWVFRVLLAVFGVVIFATLVLISESMYQGFVARSELPRVQTELKVVLNEKAEVLKQLAELQKERNFWQGTASRCDSEMLNKAGIALGPSDRAMPAKIK